MQNYIKKFKDCIPTLYTDSWSLEMPYRATEIIDEMLDEIDRLKAEERTWKVIYDDMKKERDERFTIAEIEKAWHKATNASIEAIVEGLLKSRGGK